MTKDEQIPEQQVGNSEDGRLHTRVIVGISILAVCLGYACCVPSTSRFEMIDHHVFLRATDWMRAGLNYYPAMDRALREVYGPAESIRAFRTPTVFLLWSRLPSPSWIWAVYVTSVAITGLLLLNLTEIPVLTLVAVIYLLNCATTRHEGDWLVQFATTELWAVPFVAGAFAAWKSGRDRLAATLALAAVLVREITAGLLLGGLAAAYCERRPLRPWLVTTGLAAIALAAHAACVSVYLVRPGQGRETPLLGTGGPVAVLQMAGFGLPGGLAVGPVLWLVTIGTLLRRRDWRRIAAAHLALPLTGFLADRPHWGILIVPFTMLFSGDSIRSLLIRRRRVPPVRRHRGLERQNDRDATNDAG